MATGRGYYGLYHQNLLLMDYIIKIFHQNLLLTDYIIRLKPVAGGPPIVHLVSVVALGNNPAIVAAHFIFSASYSVHMEKQKERSFETDNKERSHNFLDSRELSLSLCLVS